MKDRKIQVVADENMPVLCACFGDVADIKTLSGREICTDDVNNCDALMVRSITQVGADLVQGSVLKFVGSATIGTDHIDKNCLSNLGVKFAHAPGSNAQSVVEYVISALALWCIKKDKNPNFLTVGIIGHGQIGSRLCQFLEEIGVRYFCCDPVLESKGVLASSSEMSDIQQCDVISCHVPLSLTGENPTHHLINDEFMSGMKSGSLIINTSRGAVVENKALLKHLQDKHIEAVLDVWETEPVIDQTLLDKVFIGTPHIAGYAFEAKIRGTFMLYQAFCRHFNIKQVVDFSSLLPSVEQLVSFRSIDEWLDKTLNYYDIACDDLHMRKGIYKDPQSFDLMRKNYRIRREFLDL